MALLDDVLAATGSPRIISEQHNIDKIDINGGGAADLAKRIASIRNGNWDAAEYGITAEQQIAQLEATQGSPEALAKLDAEMIQRAIKRAGLDTSNGRIAIMTAGKLPWHGLGTNVEHAPNSIITGELSYTNWTVSKRPLFYTNPDGSTTASKQVFSLVRDDTNQELGTVGSRYQVIQNRDAFTFLDDVLSEFGARYESAGSIYGGQKVFMVVKLPQQQFSVNGKDAIEAYAAFTNPHDGSGRAFCYPTSVRIECANTYRVSAKERNKGIGIRHTGNLRLKIDDAKRALGLAVKEFDTFKESAEAMAHARLPEIKHYANDVLDAVLEVTAADVLKGADALAAVLKVTEAERDLERKAFAKKIERRGEVLQDILERYEEQANGVNGMRGTVWSGFNACTEHFDHGVRYTGNDDARNSRRFESVLAGDSDDGKQAAYTTALQYMQAV